MVGDGAIFCIVIGRALDNKRDGARTLERYKKSVGKMVRPLMAENKKGGGAHDRACPEMETLRTLWLFLPTLGALNTIATILLLGTHFHWSGSSRSDSAFSSLVCSLCTTNPSFSTVGDPT